tara:strand:- start:2273 stop:2956 length:684 start_codon:yes stop_codon:yes gene_type:complete
MENKEKESNESLNDSKKTEKKENQDDMKAVDQEQNDSINDDKNEKEITKEEELLVEISNLKEEKIRLLAEMENLRKRFEREKIESIKFGNISLARDILSPGDNLERALASIPENEDYSDSIKNLIEGLKMVQKEFLTILEKNEVKKINSLNKKFDHNYHQAVTEIERSDIDEGIVIQEIQTGYTMYDRLLRPAMVGVSKKPSDDRPSDKTENTNNEKSNKNKENKEK